MGSWARGAAALAVVALVLARQGIAQAPARPLVIAVPQTMATLDPTSTRNATDIAITQNYDEPLWDFDAKGNVGNDGLAAIERSPDGKVLTFHLRHGVKFQSGDDFTARDVQFSWEREVAKQPTFAHLVINVDHTEIVDDDTFRVYFKKFDVAFLPWRDLYIVSKAYFDRVGEAEAVAHPIGTGPYRLTGYVDGQSLDLQRFDGYWGRKPPVAAARIRFLKEDAVRVAALRAGEADLIAETPYPNVEDLRKAGFRTVSIAAFPSILMRFHLASAGAPWANPKVREAMVHAINADEIVKGLFHGIPQRSAFLMPGEFGYDPALKPYAYDPALARKLLAEAGYAKGFQMPVYYQSDISGVKETATAVVLYLKQVGIDAELKPADGSTFFDIVIKNAKNPDFPAGAIIHAGSAANNADPTQPLTILFDSRGSFAWYVDPDMNAPIDALQSEPDDARRAAEIKAAYRMAYASYAVDNLWNTLHVYTMRPGVSYNPPPKPNAIYVKAMEAK